MALLMAVTSYLVTSTGPKENSEFCFPLGASCEVVCYIAPNSKIEQTTKF